MRAHDARTLSVGELEAKLNQARHEYRAVREAVRQGKEKNHTKLREARVGIARLETVLREKVVRAA